jgi:colicin import membrane protein
MSVHAYNSGIGDSPSTQGLAAAISISVLCHLLIFAASVYYSQYRPEKRFVPSVIRVNMVALPPAGPEAPPAAVPPRVVKSPAAPKKAAVPVGKKAPATPKAKKAVSLSKKRDTRKTSMKKKTYRPSQVVKKALRRIEKQVDQGRPDPLSAALDRLKAKVADDGPRTRPAAGKRTGPTTPGAGRVRQLALIDIYRVEIAHQIQKNWAFSGSVAGGRTELTAELAFTVMPDGQIRDVWFDKRSGNRYLDESARKAVVKSNPVRPHPAGILRPYVTVGLRFTPEGVTR